MSITTHETTYAEPPNGTNRRRFITIGIAIIALVTIAAAFLIWNGSNDAAKPSTLVRTVPKDSLRVGEASADLSLSTKVVGGEPRGFPHTEAGAIEAATAAAAGTAGVLNHSVADNRAFLADTFPGAPDISTAIAKKKTDLGLADDGQLIHPLEGDSYYNDSLFQFGAYGIDSSAPNVVTVRVWAPNLNGPGRPENPEKLNIAWHQSTYEMHWARSDWRVSNGYGVDATTFPLPSEINRVDVSFKERRRLLGPTWLLYQGASEKWPVDLLGPDPQGNTQ